MKLLPLFYIFVLSTVLSCTKIEIESLSGDKAVLICNLRISGVQGSACYGDYLFQFTAQNSSNAKKGVMCYNLRNSTRVCFVDLGYNENYHNSHVSFGSVFYSQNDQFPLLYVSENSAKNDFYRILEYRITQSNNVFVLDHLHSIPMPRFVLEEHIHYPHVVFDRQSDSIWIEGYSADNLYNVYMRFSFPKEQNWRDLVSSALPEDFFKIPRDNLTDQSFVVYNNRSFQIIGEKKQGKLRIIDLLSKTIDEEVVLSGLGLSSEPEGVFIWDNRLFISFYDGLVFEIVLKNGRKYGLQG